MYSRKVKWRLPEQRQKREPADQEEGTHAGAWRSNFSSVDGLQKEVEAVILDQYRRGQFLRLTPAQAKARFGSLARGNLFGGSQKRELARRGPRRESFTTPRTGSG